MKIQPRWDYKLKKEIEYWLEQLWIYHHQQTNVSLHFTHPLQIKQYIWVCTQVSQKYFGASTSHSFRNWQVREMSIHLEINLKS